MIEVLTILNTVGIFVLILRHYWKRLSFEVDRTFWRKKAYGFHLTLWDRKKGVIPNSGTSFFAFNWRDPEKINDNINRDRG
jgi:hypothetical protein